MTRTKYPNRTQQYLPATQRQPGERICPARNPNGQLTLKEELFVRAICCHPEDPTFDNLTAAMKAAGYKSKNVGIMAYEMLHKPKIASAVEKYRLRIMREFDISPKKILQEIAAAAFSNFQDFYSDDGSLKNLKQLDRTTAAALHGVDVSYGKGLDGTASMTQKIRLHDKLKGLELLGKYHKLWTDNVNITNLDSELSLDERAEQQQKRLLSGLTVDEDDGKE
jgi:phage terminase small subunit